MNYFRIKFAEIKNETEEAFRQLREFVEVTLRRSAYQNIKLSRIFQQMNKK